MVFTASPGLAGDFLGPVAFPGPSSHLSAYIHTHCGNEKDMYPSQRKAMYSALIL